MGRQRQALGAGGLGALSRAGRCYERLLAALGLLAGLAFAALALLVGVEVALRNFGLGTIPWLIEVAEYGLYATTFLAAPWVLRLDAHVRVDLLLVLLPRRGARALEVAANLVGFAASAVLFYYGLAATLDARGLGSMIFKELVLPEWWLLAIVPLGSLFLLVEFGRRLFAPPEAPPPAGEGA